MLAQITYPLESSFYPYALVLLILIVLIIISIIVFFLWLRKKTTRAFPLNIENHISLATLVVTVVVVFIPYFVQTPILDFSVYGPSDTDAPNVKELRVNVNNYGIVPAKNIIISMNTNSDGVQFLGFTSNPLLSTSSQVANQI
jgi:heme/copper-type cytochrome/quinol oxidase subunit 2